VGSEEHEEEDDAEEGEEESEEDEEEREEDEDNEEEEEEEEEDDVHEKEGEEDEERGDEEEGVNEGVVSAVVASMKTERKYSSFISLTFLTCSLIFSQAIRKSEPEQAFPSCFFPEPKRLCNILKRRSAVLRRRRYFTCKLIAARRLADPFPSKPCVSCFSSSLTSPTLFSSLLLTSAILSARHLISWRRVRNRREPTRKGGRGRE
jgi:hypothetical protein